MFEDDRAQTVVASADFVGAVDDIQYALGEGPCGTSAPLPCAACDARSRHSTHGPSGGLAAYVAVLAASIRTSLLVSPRVHGSDVRMTAAPAALLAALAVMARAW